MGALLVISVLPSRVLGKCLLFLAILLGLGLFEIFRLQEWPGWDGAFATFDLAKGADAVMRGPNALVNLSVEMSPILS